MVSPVSIGQQSFIGSDAHSDFYLDDKVAVWLDQIPVDSQFAVAETQFSDSQSHFDSESVCTIDMLRQITQGKSASNVSLTLSNRNAVLNEEVSSPSSQESRYSSAFLAMFNGTAKEPADQQRACRLLSVDSGVGFNCDTAGAVEPHPPLLESIVDETVHSISEVKLNSQCNDLRPSSSCEKFNELQMSTGSGTASPEYKSDSGVSGHEVESTLKTGNYIGMETINNVEYKDLATHQDCGLYYRDQMLCHDELVVQSSCHEQCHHDECDCSSVTVNMHASSHNPVNQQDYTFNDDGYVTNPAES